MRYKLTEKEEIIIDKAVNCLNAKFDCESSEWIYYFEIKDENISSEYNICYSKKCLKEQKKHINGLKKKKELGTDIEKGWIKEVASSNDSDHEEILRCSVCEKPLNEFLTWIKYEFQYFQECDIDNDNSEALKKIINNNYFELFVIFQSMPSCDFQRNKDFEKEKELFKDVVKWANFVCRHYS